MKGNRSRLFRVDGQVARKTEACLRADTHRQAPTGPARIVLPVHDESDRGRTKVLRDLPAALAAQAGEWAVVVSELQNPRERLP